MLEVSNMYETLCEFTGFHRKRSAISLKSELVYTCDLNSQVLQK